MTVDNKIFEEGGINYTEALDRFDNNEALYRRLALKFLDDRNFDELKQALGQENIEAAQHCAHSLKGVAGNLSFDRLYHIACKLNDTLAQGDIQTARKLMPQAQKAYRDICCSLQEMKP